jgi:acyl dehydratase
MNELLHFEDFKPGQVLDLGPYEVTAGEIKSFAEEFDPQPFHLDEDAAKASILGGLCASGWHSCAMLMRMIVDSYLGRTAGMGSSGLEDVKWLKPVYAGEVLKGRMTVLSARVSSKRPEIGILQSRWELFGSDGQKKLEMTGVSFVRVRES